MELLPEAKSVHAKHGCYRCARVSSVVDLDVLVEGEGVLCLCRACVLDAARTAMVTPRDDPVRSELARLSAQVEEDKILVADAEAIIVTLMDCYRRLQRRKEKEKEAAASE